MTQEEKAKAYDKALEKAKYLHEAAANGNYEIEVKTFECLFPELKESEDERIRKELIEHIKANCETGFLLFQKFSPDDVIAWLEKQGKQKDINPTLLEKEKMDDAFTKMMLKGKTALEAIYEEKVDNANKVEPKFHEGDWIVYKNDICQIVKREEGCNKLVTTFGIEKELVNERNLLTARLWTIQDAKDGDVLALNGEVFIYAHRKQMYSIAVAHCFVDSAGGFYLDGEFVYTEKGNSIHPATKEQCGLLFKKIKEAGYEWNDEKKELKKMEQKPKWTEEDEHHWMMCLECVEECATQEREDFSKTIDWLKSIKKKMEEQ